MADEYFKNCITWQQRWVCLYFQTTWLQPLRLLRFERPAWIDREEMISLIWATSWKGIVWLVNWKLHCSVLIKHCSVVKLLQTDINNKQQTCINEDSHHHAFKFFDFFFRRPVIVQFFLNRFCHRWKWTEMKRVHFLYTSSRCKWIWRKPHENCIHGRKKRLRKARKRVQLKNLSNWRRLPT